MKNLDFDEHIHWLSYELKCLKETQLLYISMINSELNKEFIYDKNLIVFINKMLNDKNIKWKTQLLPASLIFIKEDNKYKSIPTLVNRRKFKDLKDFEQMLDNNNFYIFYSINIDKNKEIIVRYSTYNNLEILTLEDFIR